MKVLNADLLRKVIDVLIETHFDRGEAPLAGAVRNLIFYIDAFEDDGIVPVVRCKDCKHYNIYRLECHNGHMDGLIGIDGFCSYGERRGDEI